MSDENIKIALCGKQGTGKTTAADYLIENYNFKRASFADKIKQVAMDLFGASHDEVYVSKSKRPLLQSIGYHMREIDRHVWTKYLTRQIKDNKQNIVIDDVRMKSEFDALKEVGFILVKIECNKEECKSRITSFANENDPTETEMDSLKDWDYTINNERNKECLYQQIDLIINKNNQSIK